MSITQQGKIFLMLCVALVFSGVLNSELSNLFHLFTGFLFALLAVSPILAKRNLSSLSLHLETPTEVFVGEEYRVQYTLTNHAIYDKFGLSFRDTLLDYTFTIPHFPVRTSMTITRKEKFSRRGTRHWKKILVTTRFPFGFFIHERFCPSSRTIHALPRPLVISSLPLPEHAGAIHETTEGFSMRAIGDKFSGLREYSPGDNPKKIHWKATAKSNQLVVKEQEDELPNGVAVFVDTFFYAMDVAEEQQFFEDMVDVAASLVWDITNRGYLLSFAQGETVMEYGYGEQHARRILRHLANITPGESLTRRIFSHFLANFPAGSAIILLTVRQTSQISPYLEEISRLYGSKFVICTAPNESIEEKISGIDYYRSNIIGADGKTEEHSRGIMLEPL